MLLAAAWRRSPCLIPGGSPRLTDDHSEQFALHGARCILEHQALLGLHVRPHGATHAVKLPGAKGMLGGLVLECGHPSAMQVLTSGMGQGKQGAGHVIRIRTTGAK